MLAFCYIRNTINLYGGDLVKKRFGITLLSAALVIGIVTFFLLDDRNESVKVNEKGIQKIKISGKSLLK
jgi:hypothetical protein